MNTRTLPEGIHEIIGTQSGPNVVIIGAMHGNERIGVDVINMLKNECTPETIHGTLTLILGNPRAYEKNIRFIDEDLNRLFGENSKSTENQETYEQQRAFELKPFLENANYLLDIHATIKPSIPFVFCENDEAHIELASLCNPEFIVSIGENFRLPELISSTDNFVDSHGGIGITYESGWHKDPLAANEILKIAKKFLKKIKCGFAEESAEALYTNNGIRQSRQLEINEKITAKTDTFEFIDGIKTFFHIKNGGIIATDGGKNVTIEHDQFIIFPKENIAKDMTACYIATDTSHYL